MKSLSTRPLEHDPVAAGLPITRRSLLRSVCCGACQVALASSGAGAAETAARSGDQSCIRLTASGVALRKTTGDRQTDIALDKALQKIADRFNVAPSVGFYPDGGNPGSYVELVGNSEGVVAIGETFFRNVMDYDASGVSLLAVLAHLFGHIAQQKSGRFLEIWGNIATPRRAELHADYLSGYYLGTARRQGADANAFQLAGDRYKQVDAYDPRSPAVFATAAERIAASQQGFNLGFRDNRDIRFAVQEGASYVSTR